MQRKGSGHMDGHRTIKVQEEMVVKHQGGWEVLSLSGWQVRGDNRIGDTILLHDVVQNPLKESRTRLASAPVGSEKQAAQSQESLLVALGSEFPAPIMMYVRRWHSFLVYDALPLQDARPEFEGIASRKVGDCSCCPCDGTVSSARGRVPERWITGGLKEIPSFQTVWAHFRQVSSCPKNMNLSLPPPFFFNFKKYATELSVWEACGHLVVVIWEHEILKQLICLSYFSAESFQCLWD